MARTVSVIVSAEDRARLAAIIGDRSRTLACIRINAESPIVIAGTPIGRTSRRK
jgi:hypothetical protein